LLGLRWSAARQRENLGLSAVVVGNLIAFGIGLPAATAAVSAPVHEWAALAYLGLFQIALAYVMLAGAVAHLPALTVSLVLLVEPVLNPVWTWAVHDERPTAWTVAGGTIIVAASLVRVMLDARTSSSPVEGGTPEAPPFRAGTSG
jgi:drug/metabolite transporter (DMT)-like permease